MLASPADVPGSRRGRDPEPIHVGGAAVTGEDGRFAIAGLDPIDYDLIASHPDKAHSYQVVGAPSIDVRIELSGAASSLKMRAAEPAAPVVAASAGAMIHRPARR